MVQISTFALVAALSAAPILAAPLTQLIEDGIATRDLGLSDKIQLEVREPFLHKITKVMPSFRRDLNDLDAREFEAFEVNIARDFADEYSGSIATRDFDEAQLNGRSPFIKKILGGIGRIFGFRRNLEELSARELEAFEDTFTRAFDEYRSSNIASRDVNDAQLRIRAPIIGKIFGGIKKIFGFRRDLDELNARELEALRTLLPVHLKETAATLPPATLTILNLMPEALGKDLLGWAEESWVDFQVSVATSMSRNSIPVKSKSLKMLSPVRWMNTLATSWCATLTSRTLMPVIIWTSKISRLATLMSWTKVLVFEVTVNRA